MTPRQTVTMLNDYFTEMVEVIFTHGGMLDKYIGDALMATFGGPISGASDADNALLVARDMMRELRRLNVRRGSEGLMPIEIGIGLSTGEVMGGSVGSAKRMEYTVIGDNVNLAARLESANKHYGTAVLLSGATAESLKSRAVLRRLDLIQVKGKTHPTLVYESLAHHTATTFPKLSQLIAAYEMGLDSYHRRDWQGALSHFGEALELSPKDRPSRILVDRCRYYSVNPPPDDWNGVWIMENK
jgi:adenylate cyclase